MRILQLNQFNRNLLFDANCERLNLKKTVFVLLIFVSVSMFSFESHSSECSEKGFSKNLANDLFVNSVAETTPLSSQTISHSKKDFLPAFEYPPDAIENAIPRKSEIIEQLSAAGTQKFSIQSTVDLDATPQWTTYECVRRGRFPYRHEICGNVTRYGVKKIEFKKGHIDQFHALLKVENERRALTVEVSNFNGPYRHSIEVLDVLPGKIDRASVGLLRVDPPFNEFEVRYSLKSENPDATIRVVLDGNPDDPRLWTKVRFEKVNGEIPKIPSVFDEIETRDAFQFFERQSKSDDWEYVRRFLSLNWNKIRQDRTNPYYNFIFDNLRLPPSFSAGLSVRLEYLKMIPSHDPMIVEQTDDPYSIVERNYQFLLGGAHGGDRSKVHLLLKELIRKGAKVIQPGSLSGLRTDIVYNNLNRVTDPELREMILKAAKAEGVVPRQ